MGRPAVDRPPKGHARRRRGSIAKVRRDSRCVRRTETPAFVVLEVVVTCRRWTGRRAAREGDVGKRWPLWRDGDRESHPKRFLGPQPVCQGIPTGLAPAPINRVVLNAEAHPVRRTGEGSESDEAVPDGDADGLGPVGISLIVCADLPDEPRRAALRLTPGGIPDEFGGLTRFPAEGNIFGGVLGPAARLR